MNQNLHTVEYETVTVDKNGLIIEKRTATGQTLTIALGNGASLEMMEIPGGSFMMGASADEADNRPNEQPAHRIDVPPFLMGKYTVTQRQWLAVMPDLPKMDEEFYDDDLPVVNAWLEQVLIFCRRFSTLTNLPFRLPTEAEWEYACRAGTTTPFNCGETLTTDLANFNGEQLYNNSPKGVYTGRTKPVGFSGAANNFGLCDMHGNVWEWCADIWHEDYTNAPTDGSAWTTNGDHSYCVQRGGSWRDRAGACRSAFRVGDIAHNTDNIVGLRVCLSF